MAHQIEPSESKPPILKRVAAGLVLVVVAALAVHIVLGVIMTIFWIALVVAVIVAVLWALNTIF